MIRVLLAEDDGEYRRIVREALLPSGCQVDAAATYDEALELLQDGALYDAAIVDLNLIEEGTDQLGEMLLEKLKEHYPWVTRIALTGMTPGTVKKMWERLGLADLLLKQSMKVGQVREVVRDALTDAPDGLNLVFRADRGERWTEFIEWRGEVRLLFNDGARTLENDLGEAGRTTQKGRELADALTAWEFRKVTFEADCLDAATILVSIGDQADLEAAAGKLATLRAKYADVG